MTTWNVYVPRLAAGGRAITVHLGTVEEKTEELARCAALSKFYITEDEYFEAIERGEDQPMGISPGDDFSVSRA